MPISETPSGARGPYTQQNSFIGTLLGEERAATSLRPSAVHSALSMFNKRPVLHRRDRGPSLRFGVSEESFS
jgi:hypothetical protein